MAKTYVPVSATVLICNSIFLDKKGLPESACCAIRGDVNGKSVKIPVVLLEDGLLPTKGEAVYLDHGTMELDDASNYRTLRNGKASIKQPNLNDAIETPIVAEARPAAPVEEIPAF